MDELAGPFPHITKEHEHLLKQGDGFFDDVN